MGEIGIGSTASLNVAALAVACWLWMIGGRDHWSKAWRRYGAALVIALSLNMTALLLGTWKAGLLGVLPALVLAYSQGYGGDTIGERIVRRVLFGLGVVMVGVLVAWTTGGPWLLVPLHLVMMLGTVWFAWRNPLHAAAEEVLVCLLLNGVLVFYLFGT